MQTVICSHGFGVRADSNGMFPEIAQSLGDYDFVTFDYNDITPDGDLVILPIEEQARKLQAVIDKSPAGSILLCHSQGCVIAGLVDLSKVGKVVLLAPPTRMSVQRVMQNLMNQPGNEVNLEGVSKLPRSDGTFALLPAEFVASIAAVNPFELYKQIAAKRPTLIVRASDDETVGQTDVDTIQAASHKTVEADHNFTGESRARLITVLRDYLQSDNS